VGRCAKFFRVNTLRGKRSLARELPVFLFVPNARFACGHGKGGVMKLERLGSGSVGVIFSRGDRTWESELEGKRWEKRWVNFSCSKDNVK
jgi:hypothetical protein